MQRPRTTTPYFTLYEPGDGLFAAIATPGSGAWGNAGIIDLGDSTLVFDTFGTPAAARALRQKAEEVTGRPVTYALNSHRHADHVLGNIVFRDIPIVATTVTRSLIAEMTPRFLGFLRESGADYVESLEQEITDAASDRIRRDLEIQRDEIRAIRAALTEIEPIPPSLTFEQKLVFHGTRRTAEFLHCGSNHTPSDSVLWLPGDGVLYAGDIVQVRTHPSMGQGDHENWPQSMQLLRDLAPIHVVPGHGEVGTAADIEQMAQYVLDVTVAAQQAAAQGLSDEGATQLPTPPDYEDYGYSPGWGQNVAALLMLVGTTADNQAG